MITDNLKQSLDKFKSVCNQANDLRKSIVCILIEAARRFYEVNAIDAAASLAYYALFSLFPLLLILIAIGSFMLESQLIQARLLELIDETIPGSYEYVIQENVQQVLEARGPIGVFGAIGLLWAAMGVFHTLAYNINRAWVSEARSFIARHLVALGMVGALAVLLGISVIASAIIDLLSQFKISWGTASLSISEVLSQGLPVVLRLFVFLGLYRWTPITTVYWIEAFWGALVATLGWEITTTLFVWYLSSDWAHYELIYGSLATLVGLMFWIYLGSLITLFGAHLSAAVALQRRSVA
jgi:membrane protein